MITVTELSSGYFHIRGVGPCEWAQPPQWPCSEDVLRAHAFPQASDRFLRAASKLAHIHRADHGAVYSTVVR